jgi:uncharacterized protein (TIGR02145 family)
MKKLKYIILLLTFQINYGQTVLEALEGGIPNTCFSSTTIISKTPCSTVVGATLNDDLTTTMGTEYNWTGATGFVDGGTVRAIVDINGQCWFKRNAVSLPSNYPSPSTTTASGFDIGWSGYYNFTYTIGEGRLYQWKAVMNIILPADSWAGIDFSTVERSRGVCPTGWHVPSDCEWQYMENYLQVPSQYLNQDMFWNARTFPTAINTGSGSFISAGLPTAPNNNQTGFSALLTGYKDINFDNSFAGTTRFATFWTSSAKNLVLGHHLSSFYRRQLFWFYVGIERAGANPGAAFSLRCLKD